jgi:hypothetical protein
MNANDENGSSPTITTMSPPPLQPHRFACPPGSTTPTHVQCPGGRYSAAGAGVCTDCAPGKYSAAVTRPSPCTTDCPQGSYCPSGTASPVPCDAGRYGATAALATSACTDVCPTGTYCVSGAVSPVLCPAGGWLQPCIVHAACTWPVPSPVVSLSCGCRAVRRQCGRHGCSVFRSLSSRLRVWAWIRERHCGGVRQRGGVLPRGLQ